MLGHGEEAKVHAGPLQNGGKSESRIVLTDLETPVPSGIKTGTPKRKEIECCPFTPGGTF